MASATTTKGATGRSPLNMVLFYVFLVLFVLVSIFPLLWVFRMSITTRAQLLDSPTVTATAQPVGDNYSTVFGNPDFIQALVNSVIVAGTMTLILAISFFPAVAIIAPLFIQFTAVGIINTYWAMIIPDVVFALPLTIWILVAFFRELPADLEEAAKVDGATTLQAFRKVIVPLAAPGVFTTAILTFIH